MPGIVAMYGAPGPRGKRRRRRDPKRGTPWLPPNDPSVPHGLAGPRVSPAEPGGNVPGAADASGELAVANYHAMRALAAALSKIDRDHKAHGRLLEAHRELSEALAQMAAAIAEVEQP